MEIFDRCILDINGNIDQYRPFSTGIGNIKCFLEHSGNIIYIFHQIAVFYKRFHGAGNIRLLEHITAQQFTVDLTGNADHGDTVSKCRGNTGDHIGGTGAGGHRTYTGSSGHTGNTAGRMGCVLFCTDQHRFDVRIQNAVEKRTYGNTGISENSTYPLCFQTFNNRICSNHFALLLYLYSIISVVSDSFTSGFWPVSRHPPHPWNSRRHRSHPHIPA